MNSSGLYLGIDMGTGGIRMLCINALGEILAQAEEEYPQSFNNGSGVHEQSPEDWWKAASACFTSLAVWSQTNSVHLI